MSLEDTVVNMLNAQEKVITTKLDQHQATLKSIDGKLEETRDLARDNKKDITTNRGDIKKITGGNGDSGRCGKHWKQTRANTKWITRIGAVLGGLPPLAGFSYLMLRIYKAIKGDV